MEMNKNKEKLDSFVAYCVAHPEERFWQSLRNWSGYSFIYATNMLLDRNDAKEAEFEDTFYIE